MYGKVDPFFLDGVSFSHTARGGPGRRHKHGTFRLHYGYEVRATAADNDNSSSRIVGQDLHSVALRPLSGPCQRLSVNLPGGGANVVKYVLPSSEGHGRYCNTL